MANTKYKMDLPGVGEILGNSLWALARTCDAEIERLGLKIAEIGPSWPVKTNNDIVVARIHYSAQACTFTTVGGSK